MILRVTPVARAERFTSLGDVFLNRHVGVSKHDRLGLPALRGQDLELFAPVAGLAFLDSAGFVGLHKLNAALGDLVGRLRVAERHLLTQLGNPEIELGAMDLLHHLQLDLMLL